MFLKTFDPAKTPKLVPWSFPTKSCRVKRKVSYQIKAHKISERICLAFATAADSLLFHFEEEKFRDERLTLIGLWYLSKVAERGLVQVFNEHD